MAEKKTTKATTKKTTKKSSKTSKKTVKKNLVDDEEFFDDEEEESEELTAEEDNDQREGKAGKTVTIENLSLFPPKDLSKRKSMTESEFDRLLNFLVERKVKKMKAFLTTNKPDLNEYYVQDADSNHDSMTFTLYVISYLGNFCDERYINEDLQILSLLIAHGGDICERTENGNTALHIVKDVALAEKLLQAGFDIEAVNNKGETPLAYNTYNRCRKIVPLFLDYGANPNVVNAKGDTPLHVFANDFTVFKKLLEKGAKPNVKNKQGQTPVMLLIKGIFNSFTWEIREEKNWTNLREIFGLLSKGKADFTLRDKEGKTVFDYISENGSWSNEDKEKLKALCSLSTEQTEKILSQNEDRKNLQKMSILAQTMSQSTGETKSVSALQDLAKTDSETALLQEICDLQQQNPSLSLSIEVKNKSMREKAFDLLDKKTKALVQKANSLGYSMAVNGVVFVAQQQKANGRTRS